jgi:hypothetical protein
MVGEKGMLETAVSKNGVAVRLTHERWTHITEEHCELAGLRIEVLETVTNPLRVLAGKEGELLAVRELAVKRKRKTNHESTKGRKYEKRNFLIHDAKTRREINF